MFIHVYERERERERERDVASEITLITGRQKAVGYMI